MRKILCFFGWHAWRMQRLWDGDVVHVIERCKCGAKDYLCAMPR